MESKGALQLMKYNLNFKAAGLKYSTANSYEVG